MQTVSIEAKQAQIIHQHIQQLGLQQSPFSAGELLMSYSYDYLSEEANHPLKYFLRTIWRKRFLRCNSSKEWKQFKRNAFENSIIICSPPKTADHSLMHTFDEVNLNITDIKQQIHYCNVWHRPRFINEEELQSTFKKVRIITAVREPISQYLSVLYQDIVAGSLYPSLLPYLGIKDFKDLASTLNEKETDIQQIFDNCIPWYVYPTNNKELDLTIPRTVQAFLPEYQKYVVNILNYPFDKEKGYTIIQEDNIEIFVYQLEKLNELVPQLSKWIGVPFDKLVDGNKASDKWVADSYRSAKKQIKLSQEFFDRCFNEPYLLHCYSEDDINKFKDYWRSHINDEK
ncbi:MAG: putative capsular polysaccharide synthesis family protein [Erysipelotrichaceae bacterium]